MALYSPKVQGPPSVQKDRDNVDLDDDTAFLLGHEAGSDRVMWVEPISNARKAGLYRGNRSSARHENEFQGSKTLGSRANESRER